MGPRLRRERRSTGGARVGRARGVPLARRPGGGPQRPLQLRLHGQRLGRSHRPDPPGRAGGAVLGRRRHRPGHLRLGAGRGRHLRQRDTRAVPRVGAPVLRHGGRREARRVLRVRARRRLRCVVAADPRRLRPGGRRVGPQRHEGLDHQRRHRRRARGGRRRRAGAEGSRPGVVHRPAWDQGAVAGPEVQEARHPGVAHGRGRARRRAGARALPAGRQGEAGRQAGSGARPAAHGREAAGHGDLRGHPSRGRARRPSASPAPPTSTRWTTPRSGPRSASRSS